MPLPAEQIRTLEHASSLVSIMKARMQLMATVLADALVEAQTNQPGACQRITQLLEPARADHIRVLKEGLR